MNILVIGSGGREHALCWKIAQSDQCGTLYAAPGNGGMADVANCVALDASVHSAVIQFCRDNTIGLVVIGPEAPLVDGLADDLAAADIPAFGPSAYAAQLEGSKGFTKDLCAEFSIPTAAYGRFTDAESAKAYVREQGAPIVIKADGLAAGKGVIIAVAVADAEAAIDEMFAGAFGDAGAEVVVEEFMTGEEASVFAISDGERFVTLATAQDHKAVRDGDVGPNTGGMGAYSPAPVMTDEMLARVEDEIIAPTVTAMAGRGHPFRGVLYAGLMITATGPKLIEYNCRFGDPECQVLMMRMQSDLVELLMASAMGDVSGVATDWDPRAALNVVMAAKGYPGAYEKGSEIRGLDDAGADDDVFVFHAGTSRDGDKTLATGGRVLNVTALGDTVTKAQGKAYEAVAKLDWPEGFCRSDIGWRAVEREVG